jgi:hypothetical protein
MIEAESEHFGEGLLGSPILKGDAIGSDEDASAIFAKFAMDENGLWRRFLKKREEARELFVAGRREATHGNVDETQAESFSFAAFVFDGGVRFAAQIDDGGDAEIF